MKHNLQKNVLFSGNNRCQEKNSVTIGQNKWELWKMNTVRFLLLESLIKMLLLLYGGLPSP